MVTRPREYTLWKEPAAADCSALLTRGDGHALARPTSPVTASTLMALPIIVLFFAQRTFIQGITMTGLKG